MSYMNPATTAQTEAIEKIVDDAYEAMKRNPWATLSQYEVAFWNGEEGTRELFEAFESYCYNVIEDPEAFLGCPYTVEQLAQAAVDFAHEITHVR